VGQVVRQDAQTERTEARTTVGCRCRRAIDVSHCADLEGVEMHACAHACIASFVQAWMHVLARHVIRWGCSAAAPARRGMHGLIASQAPRCWTRVLPVSTLQDLLPCVAPRACQRFGLARRISRCGVLNALYASDGCFCGAKRSPYISSQSSSWFIATVAEASRLACVIDC